MTELKSRGPRPALSEMKAIGRMVKNFLAYTDELEEVNSFDTIIEERKAALVDLDKQIAGLADRLAAGEADIAAKLQAGGGRH
jgi:RecB family exonuclease